MVSKLIFLFFLFGPVQAFNLMYAGWTAVQKNPSQPNCRILTDITFPINIRNTTHVARYSYVMNVVFGGRWGDSGSGWLALEPRPDHDGQGIVRANFTSWAFETTTNDPNCQYGLDPMKMPIVTCSTVSAFDYNHTYLMVMENTSGTMWNGSMVDTVTGLRTHIGSYVVPSHISGLQPRGIHNTRYFPWGPDGTVHKCDTLPWTQVVYGHPTTSERCVAISLGLPGEWEPYGSCIGRIGFRTWYEWPGYTISLGFDDADEGDMPGYDTTDQTTML